MGKGKKRKAPPGDRREQRREEAPNMFERLSNKKRFDIMGRKLKGETRQLGKLRTAATERVSWGWDALGWAGLGEAERGRLARPSPALRQCRGMFQSALKQSLVTFSPRRISAPAPLLLQRKDTLLVEYKQLRKSNAFIDRRFGGTCVCHTWGRCACRAGLCGVGHVVAASAACRCCLLQAAFCRWLLA